jgi:hypothetical protein
MLLERSAARLLVKRLTKEDAMRRTHKALATLALGLALVGATTAAAAATPPTGTPDQAARQALYQSELERNLQQPTQAGAQVAVGQRLTAQHRALYLAELVRDRRQRTQAGDEVAVAHELAAQRKALYQSELEHNLATAPPANRAAIRPNAPTDPAAPAPGVGVVATLLIGLVGGLVGGAAAMIGWTATTRQRRPRAAAGT